MQTLVIDNFHGYMTQFINGNLNSGFADVFESYSYNPFLKPGNLTWNVEPVQINPDEDIVTDLIVAGKERPENGILYVYAIGHTGRLYKIQVNDPTTYNPNYDNPVLVTTLTAESPTFTRGGSMTFYGTTEQIFIGHDKGVTRINFDGTGETFVGSTGSWVQSVPRPVQQFLGKLYYGNGDNLAEIDTTNTVTTYAKLSPGFPKGNQVRDIDVTPEGTYVEAVVTQLPLYDITASTVSTSSVSNAGSAIFRWNGTDVGYTSFTSFPTITLGANILFGNRQYTFGSDLSGPAIFDPTNKIIGEAEHQIPLPNAVSNTGNMLSWVTPYFYIDHLEVLNNIFGQYDREIPVFYGTNWAIAAKEPETDIICAPWQILVSNFGFASSSSGYDNNIFGTSKIYFSTLETSDSTTAYRLYKWSFNPTRDVDIPGTPTGIWKSQTQLFSKKITVSEIRIYADKWVDGNSFGIDLIGNDQTVIANGSKEFVASTNSGGIAEDGQLIIGDDFAWYSPDIAPTYALGVQIYPLGDTNFTIHKIEIDVEEAGK